MKSWKIICFFVGLLIFSGCVPVQPLQTNLATDPVRSEYSQVSEKQNALELSIEPTRTPFQPLTHTPEAVSEVDSTEIPTVTDVPTAAIPTSTNEPPSTELPTATATTDPGELPTATLITETEYPSYLDLLQADASGQVKAKPGAPKPAPNFSAQIEGYAFNILLAGSDQSYGGSFRTDTLLIMSIRPEERVVSLISIPRDLYVYIPAKGMHKINTAYIWGQQNRSYKGRGIGSLKDTIQYNLGVRIDRYVIVNFDGFRKIVNILGGIDVPVACAYSDTHKNNLGRSQDYSRSTGMLTVGPGLVHMDGNLALWYARSRLNSSDYDRGRRQQEVLRAIYTRAMQLNVIAQIPELYKQILENVRTDIEIRDILSFVPMALDFNAARIRNFFISGGMVDPTNINGMYTQLPKTDKIYTLIQRALSAPGEKHTTRSSTKVEICNASGNSDYDDLSAERLHYAGYQTLACTIEINEVIKQSFVQDLRMGTNEGIGGSLLGTLGLSGGRLEKVDEPESQAVLRVIIGKDYNPCFSPYTITR